MGSPVSTGFSEYPENLAKLFREAISDPNKCIYYHDDGMEKQL
ncbi:hypothetical protein CSB94_3914 [Pseudomonas aeruginosa]|nr:hypothetical protein CSB94_3914 [Pseudomonas aeruginosa]